MELSKIEEEIRTCRRCSLWKTRTNPVPGEGNQKADIMFIGEAPGRFEDLKGRPFVGAAGKVLDELLEHVGLKRSEIYITNVVKCRPPGNRDPSPEEIKSCSPYLEKQIEIIEPKIIVTLGRHSMKWVFEKFGIPEDKISRIHGRIYEINHGFVRFVLPLYHPAVAVYNPEMEDVLKKDIEVLRQVSKRNLKDFLK